MKLIELLFILLPLLLWPLTFIVLNTIFIYAMLVSVIILAIISLHIYGRQIKWSNNGIIRTIIIGIIGALILYLLFYIGYYATILLGIQKGVSNVYTMIYGNAPTLILMPTLALIGICEEIYWRGALQVYVKKKSRFFRKMPWVAGAMYYGLIHLSTLNIVLFAAAIIVGIVTSIIAYKYGILSSIITHVVWIEAIVILFPIGA